MTDLYQTLLLDTAGQDKKEPFKSQEPPHTRPEAGSQHHNQLVLIISQS